MAISLFTSFSHHDAGILRFCFISREELKAILRLQRGKKRPTSELGLELVSKELNHLVAILHVYAGCLIFMK